MGILIIGLLIVIASLIIVVYREITDNIIKHYNKNLDLINFINKQLDRLVEDSVQKNLINSKLLQKLDRTLNVDTNILYDISDLKKLLETTILKKDSVKPKRKYKKDNTNINSTKDINNIEDTSKSIMPPPMSL